MVIEATIENTFVSQRALTLTKPQSVIVRAVRFLVPDAFREAVRAAWAYDLELGKHVGTRYSPDLAVDLQDDNDFIAARRRRRDAFTELAAQNPWLARSKPSAKWLVPRSLRKDPEVMKRAEGLLAILTEVNAFATEHGVEREVDEWALIPNLKPSTPRHDRHSATPWFTGDPGVPVDIAERYMAAYVAQTTADFARYAARKKAWPYEDLRNAMLDWADKYEYALVFIASLPGASIRSLAHHQPMDLAAVVARHNERREALTAMAADASKRIKTAR